MAQAILALCQHDASWPMNAKGYKVGQNKARKTEAGAMYHNCAAYLTKWYTEDGSKKTTPAG